MHHLLLSLRSAASGWCPSLGSAGILGRTQSTSHKSGQCFSHQNKLSINTIPPHGSHSMEKLFIADLMAAATGGRIQGFSSSPLEKRERQREFRGVEASKCWSFHGSRLDCDPKAVPPDWGGINSLLHHQINSI